MKPVPPVRKTLIRPRPSLPPVGSRRRRTIGAMDNGSGLRNARAAQRAFAIAALPEVNGDDPLAELKELLRTAGVATAGELVQRRPHPDPNSYLGKGKI